MAAVLPNDKWHGICESGNGFVIQHPMDCNIRQCQVVGLVKVHSSILENFPRS